jgi:hypothetical protein
MARILLQGDITNIRLDIDPEEGTVLATCVEPECPWTETYDDLRDATEYAEDHADRAAGTLPNVTHWGHYK